MDYRTALEKAVEEYKSSNGTIIPLLQKAQELEGYLSKNTIRYIAENTGIGIAEIYGVATFYTMFRLKPQGKHVIRVCKGTACHVSNATRIMNTIKTELNLNNNSDTTADGKFTVFEVACLGCCSLAPVIMIDKTTYGKLDAKEVIEILKRY